MNNKQLEEILELMNMNKNANMFIKDFILRFRFPELALNTIDDKNPLSIISSKTTEEINEIYEKDADKIIEEYENNIKKICDKDHVKERCENDDLFGVKKEVDDEKERSINKIINQYRSTKKYGNTTGKISDYMLYNLYASYLASDNFYYDKDNPYVVELFQAINEFMRMRSRIEYNCQNIDGLVADFNKECDSVLKPFWSWRDKNYYAKLRDDFKYDFYSSDDKNLIEASINDKGRITAYEKVLEHLKTITRYNKPKQPEEKYQGLSYEDISRDSAAKKKIDKAEEGSEKYNENLLKKLKKISIIFVNLRKIEVDNSNYSYFSEYISKKDLSDVFTLRDKFKKQKKDIKDYYETTINAENYTNRQILKKYLGALRDITRAEVKRLNEICENAIDWYLTNGKKVESGEIFDNFVEPKWGSPSTVFKEKKAHDFYFIEMPETSKDFLKKKKTESTPGYSSGNVRKYNYTEDSLKTEYGVDSYGYWLRYCTMATLVNCMLPPFWGTGLVIAGAPLPLPIIFIPFFVVSGKVTIVIGLGLCGICPLPMLLFVNMSDVPSFVIPAANMAIDILKQLCGKLMNLSMKPIGGILEAMINGYDKSINDINKKIEDVDKEIYNLSMAVAGDKETLRNARKRIGKQSNTKRNKKGGNE